MNADVRFVLVLIALLIGLGVAFGIVNAIRSVNRRETLPDPVGDDRNTIARFSRMNR